MMVLESLLDSNSFSRSGGALFLAWPISFPASKLSLGIPGETLFALPEPCILRARLVLGGAPLTPLPSPEVVGRFLESEASSYLLVFDMEQRLPPRSELVQAVLRLFQEPVPRAALRRHERLFPRSDRARVTVQWLHVRDDGSNRTALIDSRCGGRGCGVGLGGGKEGWARGGRRGGSVPAGTPGSGWERCRPRGHPGQSQSPRLSAGLCLPPCGVAGW